MEENRFCFVAIVRDESPVIERCIASIAKFATSYLICDTGSVDDTVPKIERAMAQLGIPGEVIRKEWISYGENKSYLLEQVRKHAVCGTCDYIVWHDADEVFITDPNKPDSYLTPADGDALYRTLQAHHEDIFLFTTLYGGISYPRWQIVRNNQGYHWEMPFQEYLVAAERNQSVHVAGYYNLARKQGNSSRDPARDLKGIEMLEKYLDTNPENPRALFYLGQTCRDLGLAERAIGYFARRAAVDGFVQEKYLALLYAARLHTNEAQKIELLWRAIGLLPGRLEAIYDLMMIHHVKGDHVRAAAIGGLAPVSPDPGMFCEIPIRDYLFDLNYSVSLHNAGHDELAYTVGSRLLAKRSFPAELAEKVKNNLEFFAARIRRPIHLPPPIPALVIVDDFYPDPDAMRKFALNQDFNVEGNYPGLRTRSFATPDDKRRFEAILGRNISYFPEGYNGSFQIVTKDRKSWIHRDLTRFGGIVYLSPNPPANSGTIFYRHRETGLMKSGNAEMEKRLNFDSHDESKWEVIDRIGNKFNRLILFDGFLTHKSDEYFGDSPETGRLFQTFFFDVQN